MRAIPQPRSAIEPIKRAAALLLTLSMLTAGVLKAQGCQSAPQADDATPQAQPVAPTQATDAPNVAAPTNAAADASADTQADAQADMEEPEFFPATKSGMPIRPNRKLMPATKSGKVFGGDAEVEGDGSGEDIGEPTATPQQAPKK